MSINIIAIILEHRSLTLNEMLKRYFDIQIPLNCTLDYPMFISVYHIFRGNNSINDYCSKFKCPKLHSSPQYEASALRLPIWLTQNIRHTSLVQLVYLTIKQIPWLSGITWKHVTSNEELSRNSAEWLKHSLVEAAFSDIRDFCSLTIS